jgi:hypothetical protein
LIIQVFLLRFHCSQSSHSSLSIDLRMLLIVVVLPLMAAMLKPWGLGRLQGVTLRSKRNTFTVPVPANDAHRMC